MDNVCPKSDALIGWERLAPENHLLFLWMTENVRDWQSFCLDDHTPDQKIADKIRQYSL